MKLISELFRRVPVDIIVNEQLYEARRQLVEHEAAAEHHAALTEMYRRRIQRLSFAEPKDDTGAIDLKTGKRIRVGK